MRAAGKGWDMMQYLRLALLGFAPVALSAFLLAAAPANAQAGSPAPLPTVPGAERAGEGGLTGGHPSTPAKPGQSPLEPYLITWLLPVSGVLTVLAGVYVDRRLRAIDRRRKVVPREKAPSTRA